MLNVVFSDGDFLTYTRHEPVGVCGQIIPVRIPVTSANQNSLVIGS